MKCKAQTKRNPQCPLNAVRDGYCTHHHPAARIAKMESSRARLSAQMAALDREIQKARADLANAGTQPRHGETSNE